MTFLFCFFINTRGYLENGYTVCGGDGGVMDDLNEFIFGTMNIDAPPTYHCREERRIIVRKYKILRNANIVGDRTG